MNEHTEIGVNKPVDALSKNQKKKLERRERMKIIRIQKRYDTGYLQLLYISMSTGKSTCVL